MQYQELEKYNLIGGTGLSIQLNHRLSEDLDLFYYNPFPGKRLPLPKLDEILSRFKTDFSIDEIENLDKHSARLTLNGIKVDLHSENQFHGPKQYSRLGTIRLPGKFSLLGMKLVALTLRDQWRDVYDIFSLKKEFKDSDFYTSYEKVMSSNYCGKGSERKKALFNATIKKLQDEKLLTKLYDMDSLAHLNVKHHVTPHKVIEAFLGFPLRNPGKKL